MKRTLDKTIPSKDSSVAASDLPKRQCENVQEVKIFAEKHTALKELEKEMNELKKDLAQYMAEVMSGQ